MQIAKERLYLTEGRDALVREGDPKGASLYAAPGDQIPDDAARAFGLRDGGLPGDPQADEKAAAEKAAAEQAAAEQAEAERLAAEQAAAEKEATARATKEAAPGKTKGA